MWIFVMCMMQISSKCHLVFIFLFFVFDNIVIFYILVKLHRQGRLGQIGELGSHLVSLEIPPPPGNVFHVISINCHIKLIIGS